MREFECKYCEGPITNPANDFWIECPHCERGQFGCPVCGAPLKGTRGIHSHFTFAAPKSQHTSSKEQQFRQRIQEWKEEQQPDRPKRSEIEIQKEWIRNNKSDYSFILTEVPVGKTRDSSQPRQIDIVAVTAVFELPGYIGGEPASKGEQWLMNTALHSDNYSTEKKLRQLSHRHQDESLDVELYEVKRKLNPTAIGQLLVYTDYLPKEYNVDITQKGVIYGKEYRMDRMCAEVAKNQGMTISRV